MSKKFDMDKAYKLMGALDDFNRAVYTIANIWAEDCEDEIGEISEILGDSEPWPFQWDALLSADYVDDWTKEAGERLGYAIMRHSISNAVSNTMTNLNNIQSTVFPSCVDCESERIVHIEMALDELKKEEGMS